ncbi:Peptide deformylase [Paramicrosporidium saccamoebae]|uniref:Peptide deformylase n=1 Tax=Paramicrosporidium saccamoebae TaxID=1246581 RepID=A0A2H9TGB1_9FUNG|nr:Peptide deformylase [Paramicrosporidium saccamoebae]
MVPTGVVPPNRGFRSRWGHVTFWSAPCAILVAFPSHYTPTTAPSCQEPGLALRAVGICAPQLGFDFCLLAWRDYYGKIRFLCNPKITPLGTETFSLREGCLSSPGLRHEVIRTRDIVVNGVDLEMKPVKYNLSKLDAAIIQHEMDHLEGRPWPPQIK